ncbi:DinB family protein [Mangrovimonas sp. DI 80]|uniref:DinB family protein n=1 Tax=Mangrovimonas sp. DI 80 TaxID=1779330 RepID=UPI0009780860|nr:DinB family protein [Mangrovimonas sp. DI 80]OMP30006.1 damage-inducible protein DinB [Mangrovimonas sp. DI 80]
MDSLKNLQDELLEEYHITQKFFKLYPNDKNDYAPHEKSMKMGHLSTHIAEIFGWPEVVLTTDELDFKEGDGPKLKENAQELEQTLNEKYEKNIAALRAANEADLSDVWALKMKGHTIKEWSKYGAIRHSLNQITHHRAQLGVYYRLLGIPVPASYGPSADEQNF